MIFTHTGKLGDFIYTLPIANWYYKTYNEKIHYVLQDGFPPFNFLLPEFYKYLPYVEKISFVPHKIKHYNEGGQPYKFDPSNFGIEGKYYNLGFRFYPDKYTTLFIAEEHGFGFDYENLIDIKPDLTMSKTKIFTNEFNLIAPRINVNEFIEIPFDIPLHVNVTKLLAATEIRTYMSGFSALCDILNPQVTYIYTATDINKYCPIFFKNHDFYMKNNRYISVL